MNTDIVVIPGGMTSQLQMLDVVNKPFRENVKQLYSEWLLRGDYGFYPSWKNQEAQCLLFEWIIMAWQHVSPAVTDDDMLWNGSEEDGNVRSESEEDWY
jgi:hypothetical protein